MDSIYMGLDQSSSSHCLIILYPRGALVKPAVGNAVGHLQNANYHRGAGAYAF